MPGIKYCLLFLTLGFGCSTLPARTDTTHREDLFFSDAVRQQPDELRPHIVFLHLDKNHYLAGENIWFKAYLIDPASTQLLRDSVNLYVELVNSRGEAVDIRLFLVTEGVAWGDFALPENIEDGNYILRAYSQWMKTFGDDLCFSRFLYIRNPDYASIISRRNLRLNNLFNRDLEKKKDEIHVRFFPEGGDFVAGLENRLAFRVTDGLGSGLDAEGMILNRQGEFVTDFVTSHSGMGTILITPLPGESYHASLKTNKWKRKYPLPAVASRGYVLRVTESHDSLHVLIRGNFRPGDPGYSEVLILKAQHGGEIILDESLDGREGLFIFSVNRRIFPTGISSLTVYLPDNKPVLHREIFVNRRDHLIISATMLSESAGDGKSELLINVIDPEKGPVAGRFSVSVQASGEFQATSNGDLVSYLHLGSRFAAIVEDPLDYIAAGEDARGKLDLLMLAGEKVQPDLNKVPPAVEADADHTWNHGITIRGMVINPSNNKPVPEHSVQLRVLSGHNHLFSSKTNSEGLFNFRGLYYSDSVDIELISNRLQGGALPFISLMIDEEDRVEYVKNIFTEPQSIVRAGRDWKRPPRRVTAGTAGKIPGTPPSMYGTPDQIIYVDEKLSNYRSMLDILVERGSGISFNQGQLRIRGSTSYFGSNEPLLFVDGTQMDIRSFALVNPRDVNRIEIFKGANSAIFGSRGANGAILAHTKRYANISHKEYYDFTILGYHTPREFYNDRFPAVKSGTRYLNPFQTILWEPDFRTDQNGKGTLLIPAPRDLKSLRIIIQGIGLEGGIGYEEFLVNAEE